MRFITAILIFTAVTAALKADDRSNAKGLGMSTASVVSSYGIDAFGINPANFFFYQPPDIDSTYLKLKRTRSPLIRRLSAKPTREISLMSVGGGFGSDKDLNFYNEYIKYLSIRRESFANRFLNLDSVFNFRQNVLPDEDTDVSYDFELKWLAVNYTKPKFGAVNFTISDKVGLNTNVLNRDASFPFPTITFYPNGSYDILNSDLKQSEAIAWWIRKYSLGYAKQFNFCSGLIRNITLGISGGLVQGFGSVIIYDSEIRLDTYGIYKDSIGNHIDSIKGKQNFYTLQSLTDFFQDYINGAEAHFTFFPKPAGTGYSFDLGLNMQLGDNLWIGASITELGKINWDYNTVLNLDTNNFSYKNFYVLVQDPTYNELVNNLNGLYSRIPNALYTTDMPTKYRAGILYKPFKELSLELDWQKGANKLPSNSNKHKFSVGGEYYALKNIAVRTGFSIGGLEGLNIALGLGFKYGKLVLDIATYNLNKIWRQFTQNNRVSLSVSGKLLF